MPLDYGRTDVTGACRPPCRQSDRTIDWAAETTEAILPRLRAADSSPGVLDTIGDTPCIRVNNIGPKNVRLYVKAEAFNPASSVKDRLAVNIIEC